MTTKKVIAIIPARYASTRFPGKPLALLGGEPIIERVYKRVSQVIEDVYVATDDQRIFDAVDAFGGKVVMTSTAHKSGTDRCCEALNKIANTTDVVINIQGDEPFISASQLQAIQQCFDDPSTDIATLVQPFKEKDSFAALSDINSPKVVLDNNNFALYFSRSTIPFQRNIPQTEWLMHHTYYKHIGIYAFRASVLKALAQLPVSDLERCESLEQLRWLQAGYRIKVAETQISTIGIDTPEDLKQAETFLTQHVSK